MDNTLSAVAKLARRVAALSDESADAEATIDAAKRRALSGWRARRSDRAPQSRPLARTILAGAALAAACALVLLLWTPRSAALTYLVGTTRVPHDTGAWVVANAAEDIPIQFSDGSSMTLASQSRARVMHTDSDGASLLLERGQIHAKVVHVRPSTRWSVQAGPFEILVVGTEFDAAWDPISDTLKVTMIEGRVQVNGPLLAGGRTLEAGDRLSVSIANQRIELGSAAAIVREEPVVMGIAPDSPARVTEPSAQHGAPPVAEVSSAPAKEKPRPVHALGWRELETAGRHRDAMEAVNRDGFDSVVLRSSTAELFLLADAARYSGEYGRSRDALLAARNRGAGARASFLLGKIAADHQGAPAEAVRWFEACLAQDPSGGFAEQALGRLIELKRRTGDRGGARTSAQVYLERYPSGAYASLARASVEP